MYADTDDDMHLSTKLDFLNNLPGGAGIFEVVDGILYERYINDGFFKLVSDTREHRMLIAKDDIMLLVHPGDRQLLGNLIRRAGAGEDDMCETCRIMTGSGGYVWLRMFIRVVKRTGNSMEVYICYTDMQGEMAARESLERNKELLSSAIMSVDMSVWEYDVPTKTVYVREGDPRKHGPTELVLSNVPFSRSDITEMYEQEQAQLQKTENALLKAEEANQAKTDFFARMSHDLRTPMNGILGMTELSKNTDDVKELHHNLELIEISGKYMTNLINDILDLQKIESGNLHLKKKLQRCDLFIETIVDMMKPTALRKNIDFQLLNINVNLEQYARIDEIRFQQVFVNIMSNAIKFTPRDGKIKFVMETLSRDSGVEHDKFQIIDNGIGIGEEFLRNGLFNPYSKENNSMTTKYTGSGLGLAITKRIIDSMGGRIEVESHKNVGTTVTVYIDVEVLDNESAKAELEEKTGTLPLERIKGKNILVCEDHPINAEIIKDVLEMAGCQVCVAENGAEGFSAFCEAEKYFYDAILMDIRMPVMAGWEAAKCIRGLVREDASGIPIIALTANAFEEDRQHSLDVGMNDHLAKPIDARKIYETLIHYIG